MILRKREKFHPQAAVAYLFVCILPDSEMMTQVITKDFRLPSMRVCGASCNAGYNSVITFHAAKMYATKTADN
jgi:hypothetical protein